MSLKWALAVCVTITIVSVSSLAFLWKVKRQKQQEALEDEGEQEEQEEQEGKEKLDRKSHLENSLRKTQEQYDSLSQVLQSSSLRPLIITSVKCKGQRRLQGVVNRAGEFSRAYSQMQHEHILLILHCSGFLVELSYEVSKIVLQHRKRGLQVTVLVPYMVPYMARSSGTEIALSSGVIIANSFASFSPVDTIMDLDLASFSAYDILSQANSKGDDKDQMLQSSDRELLLVPFSNE